MREILFRGKSEKGEWVYGNYCGAEYLTGHGIEHLIIEVPQNGRSAKVLPDTVGQYTGLTDKNGEKIFEGDICQTKGFLFVDDKPFVVEWNSERCSFYWQDVADTDEFTDDVARITTVIGNIHDNPELLKGGVE